MFFQEHDGDENCRASSVDIESGAILLLTPERGVKALLQEQDRKFPAEVLIRHNQRDKRFFDLFRVNVATGASELVFENDEYVGLVTDSTFRLRLGVRFAADGSAECFERSDGSWAPFTTVPIGDLDTTEFLDFSTDGNTLYLRDSRGRDKAALFAFDMTTHAATLLAGDDEADIDEVIFDGDRRPFAARAVKDRTRWHAVDPAANGSLAKLAAHGQGDIDFVSRSNDDRFATVYYERDTASGEYALLDTQAGEVRTLFEWRAALNKVALHKMESVVIPSRDGLRLNGYLTRLGADAGTAGCRWCWSSMAAPTPATIGASTRPTSGSPTAAMRC